MSGTEAGPSRFSPKGIWIRMRRTLESRHPWRKVRRILRLDELSPLSRRLLVGTLGGLVLLAGVLMVVLPGPAFLVIPLGLVILATEFLWARKVVRKVRELLTKSRAPG